MNTDTQTAPANLCEGCGKVSDTLRYSEDDVALCRQCYRELATIEQQEGGLWRV